MYPKYISVEGKKFEIDTDYRTALRCFEVIYDETIDEYERAYAIIFILLGDIPEVDLVKTLDLLKKYLSCGREQKQTTGIPDMDLFQDSKYITASFMSDYKIDLTNSNEPIHWWRFITLLDGLTGECILNRIRDIRTCDISDYKGKSRAKMLKAKSEVALKVKLDDESQKALDAFDKLLGIGNNELQEDDYLLEEEVSE